MAEAATSPSPADAEPSVRFNAPIEPGKAPSRIKRQSRGKWLARLWKRLGELRPLGLGLWDWAFIFFLWLTLFYTVAIIVGAVQTGDWDVDFMPITAGIPFILVAWPAVRVGERMAEAMARLDDDAGLILAEGDTLDALRAELNRGVRTRELILVSALGLLMAGILAALLAGGQLAAMDSGWIALLGPVLVVVGAALGALVGRIWGYGRLLKILEMRNARFAGVLTRETRRTLARLRGLFLYGFWATAALCHWFIAWFAAWLIFGFRGGGYFEIYERLFWVMFAVSLILSFFAGYRPLISFLRHLDGLYGGREAEDGIRSQIRQARDDLERVRGTDPPAEHDLRAFIAEKEADPISAGLVIRWGTTGVLLWQLLWLALSAPMVSSMLFRTSAPAAAALELFAILWS